MENSLNTKRLLVVVCLFTGSCVCMAVMECQSDEVCSELQHQVCRDTDGDGRPDTCLCEDGYYLRLSSCEVFGIGVTNPCRTSNPCQRRGKCQYDTDLHVMSCQCRSGTTGSMCQMEVEVCGKGWYYNADSGACEACPLHTYKETHGNHGCSDCPSTGPRNRTITTETGVSTRGKCSPAPRIETFLPPYGPLAGGTLINVSVSHLEGLTISQVTVAAELCHIVNHNFSITNSSFFQCLTSEVREVVGGPVVLLVLETEVTSPDNYTYLQNPVITELDGINTIIKGGLTLTVIGQHLDSIYQPILEVTRVLRGVDTRVFTTLCTVRNSSEMGCPTPDLTEGFQLIFSSGGRRRRAVQGHDPDDLLVGHRVRRDVPAYAFNTDDTRFLIGFRLDGVERYRNLSAVLPEFSELIVYPNPQIKAFEEEHGLYYFDPNIHRGFLHLKGRYLDFAAQPSDYLVTIGVELCHVTSLFTNGITCRAPPTEPKAEAHLPGPHGKPQVTVRIGNLRYVVGYISYVSATSRDAMIGAIVGGLLIVVLLAAAGVACHVYLKRRKMAADVKNASLRTFATLNPNIYSENTYRAGRQDNPSSSYLQPLNQRTRSGRSLAPLVIPTGGMFGGSPATTPGSVALSTFTYLPDTPATPTTPLTPMQPNVAYQLPRHSSIPFDVMDEMNEDLRLIINECRIESSRLSLQTSIGKGFFGKVYRGLLSDENGKNPVTVAIKTVQGQQCTVKDVESFLAEAVVMKDFNHVNVLSLLGVVIAGNRPYAVLPYMENGDLKTYISGPNRSIKVRELIGFGVEVAGGMEYLTNQKFVHRDLATRNCMIDKMLTVKIADFGLSRDIYRSDYYRVEDKHRPLPVKWMAVESLTAGVFSAKSDVWSFGVLMWELLTRGCSPYPDIDTFYLKNYLTSGRRLSQPEHAPDEVYAIMCSCWRERPDDRPTFTDLREAFIKIINRQESNMMPEYLKVI